MAKIEKGESQTKQTTVEEGTELNGTLRSKCQVVVRGVVDGELEAPSVIVSETGTVVGSMRADCIRSEGVLAGHVDANDVYLSGTVRSNTVIRAKNLEVKLQRERDRLEVTFGACVLEVGDDPAAEVGTAAGAQPQAAGTEGKPAHKGRRSVPPPSAEAAGSSEAAKPNGASDEASGERRSVPPPPS